MLVLEYYINSFLKSIRGVSREVYMRCFDLSAFELEQIIKASYKVDTLALKYWNIRWSRPLDFSTPTKSNIELISLDSCGVGGRTSDFIYDFNCFENIVEAIAKSKIRYSIKTFDIRWCYIEKDLVQRMFKEHGLEKVEVVQDGTWPS